MTRLVLSCPLLEDLAVEAWWKNYVKCFEISSTSLRRLFLNIFKVEEEQNTEFVRIHAPNLEYLEFYDNLAYNYSITNMDRLHKAVICVLSSLEEEVYEASYEQMLNFIRPLSNVQHLSLLRYCTEGINGLEDIEAADQLPMFRNLKYLELGHASNYWDYVLAFLNGSPVLETLVFPRGMVKGTAATFSEVNWFHVEKRRREEEACRFQGSIPCRSSLKRIVINNFLGTDCELNWIQLLLRLTSALEELVLIWDANESVADEMTLQTRVQNLPRASVSWSIQLQ